MAIFARIRDLFLMKVCSVLETFLAGLARVGLAEPRPLSPKRMEEICVAIETHLKEKGGIVYSSAPFKGRPSGSMIWRFPELEGISAREMGMFRTGITPNMEERLKKAQQPTIDARKARRVANLARAAVGQITT